MASSSRIIRLTFLGGALGTAARFTLSLTLGDVPSIIFVNLLGAALLGWFNGNPKNDTDEFNTFWKVGFTGGFTTMSGVALLSATGIAAQLSAGQTVSYSLFGFVLLIFAASLLAYWGAHALGTRLTGNNAAVSHDVEEVTE